MKKIFSSIKLVLLVALFTIIYSNSVIAAPGEFDGACQRGTCNVGLTCHNGTRCVECVQSTTGIGDCPTANQICTNDGRCVSPQANGATCSQNNQCESGLCLGKCAPKADSGCREDRDCANDEYCDAFVCYIQHASGSCTRNGECKSGYCRPSTQTCGNKPIGGDGSGGLPTGDQGTPPNGGPALDGTVKASDVGYSFDRLRGIFVDGVCQLVRLAIVIAVIFLLYVGYQFMSAGGAENNITSAKENLKYVIIGIVIIVGIDVIMATIGNAITGSWSLLDCRGSGTIVDTTGGARN